jgi:hypothetical protein
VADVGEPEDAAIVKSWPVPLSARLWGLLSALSLNERLPAVVPAAVGVNMIATVQDPDAATGLDVEQVVPDVAIAKGPATSIAVKMRLALPVLVSATVRDGLVVPTGSDGKVGGAGKLTVGPVPVPVKLTVCGLPLALSVNEMLPEAMPIAVGLKVNATVQDPDAGTELAAEQVVPDGTIAKGPDTPMAVKVRLVLPVLVSVTVWGGLVVPTGSDGKVSGADNPTMGPVPVPVRLTVCGLFKALSEMVREPVRVPTAVGVKVTLIVQLEPAARLAAQVFVASKSEGSAPVTTMLDMARLTFPALESVTACAALVVPTCCPVKVRLLGEKLAPGKGKNTLRFSLARIAQTVAARPTLSGMH